MNFFCSTLLFLSIFLANKTFAEERFDRIGLQILALNALYLDENLLEALEDRLEFAPIKDSDLIPFSNDFIRYCPGTNEPVLFEPKKGEKLYWGIKVDVPAGKVTYTPENPKDRPVTIENPLVLKKCTMKESVIKTIFNIACSPPIAANRVIIHSAFRDPIRNVRKGGKSRSHHMLCNAMDFTMQKLNPGRTGYERISNTRIQFSALLNESAKGVGIDPSFTHVDTRPGEKKKWTYPQNKK